MNFPLYSTFLFAGLLSLAHAKTTAPPNYVLFFTDDQGYNDVGCYGSSTIRTPNIDRMAREGIRFTDAYVGSPVCGPSRAALMTGSYPIRVGEPWNKKHLHTIPHSDEVTIPELLKSAGYTSAVIGKWHLGGKRTGSDPLSQGFDYFFGTPAYNGFKKLIEDSEFRTSIVRNEEVVIPRVEQAEMDQLTAMYTKEATDFIRKNKEQPFFLYLAHNMPHVPLGASDKFRGKSKGGLYGDVIEELDWSLGEILRCLRENDLEKNTLVIFASDNGPWIEDMIGDHAGNADPLRGAKMKSWEGGPRVPFIASWPGTIKPGRVSDALVTTMDLLPSFVANAGLELPKGLEIDGRDLSSLLRGQSDASPHTHYYYYCYTGLHGVRDARWKLVLPRQTDPDWMGWWGRHIDEVRHPALYDLRDDPAETRNIATAHPEIVSRLMKEADRAREELGDAGVIGKGARFHDKTPKRPDIAAYESATNASEE